ncbi:HAD-IA family hydrolase [Streptomyces flaveolus]|uniref:HAD-IA family hydrolase n=1 Tax=Streptomyces flaveolus TaxID=67297 RepID=UPI000B020282
MVARLEESGELRPGPVREALLALPRQVLMPQAYVRRSTPEETPPRWDLLDWSRPADRDELLERLHSGDSVAIQHDGEPILGRTTGPRHGGVMSAMSSTMGMTADLLQLLNSGDIAEDLAGVTLLDPSDAGAVPDVAVVGGAGPEFGYAALNRAFGHLQRGARLVAMHRNLYWRTDHGLQLDSGAFLTGLEAAARTEAEVTGKPSRAFFEAALAHLGVRAEEALLVGDDIESDVLAAQRAGLTEVLVRTGKYLPETERQASGRPDRVVGSFADVPALLARPGPA